MKVMMTKTAKGISRADGASTMAYEAGKEYEGSEEWELRVLGGFVRMGVAHEIGGNAGPTETKKAPKKKATPKKAATTKSKK